MPWHGGSFHKLQELYFCHDAVSSLITTAVSSQCRRQRLTLILTDGLPSDSRVSPFSCFLSILVIPIITSWIQEDRRGNPSLHHPRTTSELHETWKRKMRRGYPYKFNLYSISKSSTSAVSVSGEWGRQERKDNLKFSWKTQHKNYDILLPWEFCSDFIFVLLWEAALAY